MDNENVLIDKVEEKPMCKCAFCFDEIVEVIRLTKCIHKFCPKCISYLDSECCPVCYADILPRPLKKLRQGDVGSGSITHDATLSLEKKSKRKAIDLEKLANSKVRVTPKEDIQIWFTLIASKNQETNAPLKQLINRHLLVKDTNLTVSFIKNHIADTFMLDFENEVELYFMDMCLDSSMVINDLIQIWKDKDSPSDEKIRPMASGLSEAECFYIGLTYGHKNLNM